MDNMNGNIGKLATSDHSEAAIPSPKIQPVELSNSNRPPFPFNEIPSLSHSIKTLTYHVPPAIIYDIVMMQCILCTAFIFDKYFWNVSTTKSWKSWQVMIRTALPLRSHWLENRKSRDASEVKITTSVTNACGRLKKLNIGGKAEHRKGDYEPEKRKDWCLCLKLWISNLPCIVLGLSFVLVSDRIRSENNNCCRVAKSDLNSTEAYFATKKISTKKWPKNDLKLPKLAQKWPKIAKNGPKMNRNGPK